MFHQREDETEQVIERCAELDMHKQTWRPVCGDLTRWEPRTVCPHLVLDAGLRRVRNLSFTSLLGNAAHMHNVPGRRTDMQGCV